MTDSTKATKKNTRWRWPIRIGFVLVCYALIGFLVVPAVIKSQLIKRLSVLTHRTVSVEKVHFNPFSLAIELIGFSLNETNGEAFASFDNFSANFNALSSISHLTWTFDTIHLEQPHLAIAHLKDGSFNFSNLLDTNSIPATNSTQAQNHLPPVLVHSLSISNGAVMFADFARLMPFKKFITPINLSLTNFSTLKDGISPCAFQARTDSGELVSWRGSNVVNPPSSKGTFELEGLQLAKYYPYSHELGGLDVSNGILNVSADYQFASSSNGLALSLSNLTTGLKSLDVRTTDGRAHLLLGSFRSQTTIEFQTFEASNSPSITISNAAAMIGEVSLQTPADGETVFTLSSFTLTNARANMSSREAQVGLVHLSRGTVSIRQNKDGTINLLSLLPQPSAQTKPAATSGQTNPFAVLLDEIVLDDFAVKVEDQTPAADAKFNLDKIHLQITGFSTASNAPIGVDASLRFQDTGTVTLKGKATLSPFSADAQIELSNLPLQCFEPYVQEHAKLAITSGSLDLSGHARYAAPNSPDPAMSFNGSLSIEKLATTDDVLFKNFASWDSLHVNGIAIALSPDKFHADEVNLSGLKSSLLIGTNKESNLQTILSPQARKEPGIPAKKPVPVPNRVSEPQPEITLGALTMENASLHFSDHSIEPNCVFDLQELGGKITGLSTSEDSTAGIDLKGKVDARSPFSISGKLNPLGKDLFLDMTVGFTNTDLSAFSPYAEKFVGRPLNKGKLSFGVHYSIQKKALKAANSFYVDQLSFGPKNTSQYATTIPVKLAVALLKDRQGRIELNVPVEGRLDDPQFAVGPIIWQVVGNLITKAVTSPFSLLGSMFGGGPELSFVQFNPGEFTLPAAETNKLNSLTKALEERPELTVELNGSVNPSGNRELIARGKLKRTIGALWIKEQTAAGKPAVPVGEVVLNPADYDRLLTRYYTEQVKLTNFAKPQTPKVSESTPTHARVKKLQSDAATSANSPQPGGSESRIAEMESRLSENIPVTESDLRGLMQKRAMAVQEYFLKTGKINADRIFITAPKPMSLESKGEDRVNLTLD